MSSPSDSELQDKIDTLEEKNKNLKDVTDILENVIDRLEDENITIKELESDNSKLQNKNLELTKKINTEQEIPKKEQTQSNTVSEQGFSGLVCKRDSFGWVQMTGKYTNGNTPYSFVSITLAIIGEQDEVLDTGIGIISNIDAHQTKIFTASSDYSGNYKSCYVEINSGY